MLCAALALGLLAGCGSEAAQPEMSEVVAAVEAVVPTDGMTQYDANYIKNVFKLEESDYADCCVMATNVGTTIDEFGIFKGADEHPGRGAQDRRGGVSPVPARLLDARVPARGVPEAPGRAALGRGRLCDVRHPLRRRQGRRRRGIHRLLRGLRRPLTPRFL